MKSGFGLCALLSCAVVLSQACGGGDDEQKANGPDYAAQGGDGAAGESATIPSGTAGRGGSASDAGGPSSSSTAGAPSSGDGGAAGAPRTGGVAGDAGSGDAGSGGADASISCELAPSCTQDLSGLGTGDFSIAFTLTTSTAVRSGLISQRAVCENSKYWDVRLGATASGMDVTIELNDQEKYTSVSYAAVVNDGEPHDLRFCRKTGRLYALVDGVLVGNVPSEVAFTTLAALAIGTSTCQSFDGTMSLLGSVTDVCVGAL